ncbi:hypothetical protein ACJMK2_033703 [Sinanodonta woodiana]|uniref:Uncharacterized protein n=1 Tax=Sinanodonta woodiana TaxID=1069815 RepID=A0ABD3WR25_SINWO
MGTRLLNKIPMKKFQYRKRSDEGINLLQACYENPLFEEDGEIGEPVSSVRNGPRETIAKGNGSSGNYRFDPTVAQDTIVDFKESSKWKRRALYIITGGIVIIATLGILTGIIVSKGR